MHEFHQTPFPTKIPEALQPTCEAHTQRLFELYELQSARFNKFFSTVLGFSWLFFLFLFIPYISLLVEEKAIQTQLTKMQPQLANQQSLMNALNTHDAELKQLNAEIKQGAKELRQFLQSLTELPVISPTVEAHDDHLFVQQTAPSQERQHSPCTTQEQGSKAWYQCQIKEKISQQVAGYQQHLIKIETGLSQENKNRYAVDTLQKAIKDLPAHYLSAYQRNPNFWRTFQGKQRFYAPDKELKRFLDSLAAEINTSRQAMSKELKKLAAHSSALIAEKKSLASQQQTIEKRLTHVNSPLGKLPVGLHEALLVFPLFLAFGGSFVISILGRAVLLRHHYLCLHLRADPEQHLLTNQQLSLTTPLWIDPLKTGQFGQYLILYSPALLFILSGGYIILTWWQGSLHQLSGLLNISLYGSLYTAGLIAFFYSAYQLQKVKALTKKVVI